MSDSADEGGFHPHPGDPWHPEWTEDAVAGEVADTGEVVDAPGETGPKKRRGLFRRKRPTEGAEQSVEHEISSVPADGFETGWEDPPTEVIISDGVRVDDSPADMTPLDEAPAGSSRPAESATPLPAWLSERASAAGEESGLSGESGLSEDFRVPGESGLSEEFGVPGESGLSEEFGVSGEFGVPVEPPTWVGDTIADAGGIGGGLDEPPAIEAADPGSPDMEPLEIPTSDDLEEVLMAIGGLGDDVEVIAQPGALPEELDEEPAGLTPSDPESAAASSEYGVAGREAFEVLRDIHDEDLGEWRAFTEGDEEPTEGSPTSPPPAVPAAAPPEATPQPEEFDDWLEPEPPRKRGIWPFRRRHHQEEEDVELVEEPADWVGDAAMVPEGWFAEIDEDAVVPPPPHLPETEWPASPDIGFEGGPAAPREEAGEWEQPAAEGADAGFEGGPAAPRVEAGEWEQPAAEGADAGFEGGPAAPLAEAGEWVSPAAEGTGIGPGEWGSEAAVSADDIAMTEDTTATDHAGREAVAPAADHSEAQLPIEFDHGSGFDWIDESPSAPSPTAFEAPGPYEVPPTPPPFEPSKEDATVSDALGPDGEDEWVVDPIDLDPIGLEEDYDDATVELPAGYASADEMSEESYTTSATMEHRGFAEELSRAGEEDTEWQAISAAMPGVGTGVVGFDDVADLGDDDDVYEAPTRSELGTRVVTGVVLTGLLIGSVLVGGAAAAVFIGLLTLLGLGEFYGTLRHRGFRPLALFGYLGGIGMLAATWFHGPIAIPVAVGLTAVVVFFVYAFAPLRRDALTNGGLTVLGITWVVGTIAFVEPILRAERYRVLVLGVVIVTAAMDIGAYSVGRTWGQRALAPILSPNKSVEGLLGGVVVCMGVAAAVGALFEPFDLRSGLALGLVVCVAAPIGDLAESMFKRSLGVKDMGAVLPGHGGILDRIDAFLFVVPAAWVLFQSIGLLG